MLKHLVDVTLQIAYDNGLQDVARMIEETPVNFYEEIFHGCKNVDDVIGIALDYIRENKYRRKIILDGLFLDDPEAKAKLDNINRLAVATVNACQDLDVNEFVSVIGTMLDQYDTNHDLSWSDTTEAYSYLIQIREAVAAISEPLTKTV